MKIPGWFSRTEYAPLPEGEGHWERADYLEKTLANIQKVMAQELSGSQMAISKGFLQRLNLRVKLVGLAL